MTDDQILTVAQVAEELRVTSQTVRNWIDSGTLPAAKIGRSFRIQRNEVDALLARARADSNSLATRLDVWEPRTISLPRRRRESERPASVWEESAETPLPSRRG